MIILCDSLKEGSANQSLDDVLKEIERDITNLKILQGIESLEESQSWAYSDFFSDFDVGYLTVSLNKIEYEEHLRKQKDAERLSNERRYPSLVRTAAIDDDAAIERGAADV